MDSKGAQFHPTVNMLDPSALELIHQSSERILSEIGMRIHSEAVLSILNDQKGVSVEFETQIATFSPEAVQYAVNLAPSNFTLYGRDEEIAVDLRCTGGLVAQSVSGEYALIDPVGKTRRAPTLNDMIHSIIVCDALPNIDIVGAHVLPSDVPVEVRDVHIIAEMAKLTSKPVRTWIHNPATARYILEILQVIAGDAESLRAKPRGMFGVEPISPLMMMKESVETLAEWLKFGQPVVIAPMVQSMGTGPMTIAGTMALQNAEILACLVIVQALAPGTGAVYACSNLSLDPRTAYTAFASPEQLLANMVGRQLGKLHGLPVGVQMGISDAIVPDTQAGMEKSTSLLIGAMMGASLTGGLGIAGGGQGASVPQLIIDDEIVGYVRAVLKGVEVSNETIAFDAIQRAGIGGNFLMDPHTLQYMKNRWTPGLSQRLEWERWLEGGGETMLERAVAKKERILREHEPSPLDDLQTKEIDRIVATAEREIIGE